MATEPPITIPCEGSGCPGRPWYPSGYGICQMCGELRVLSDDGRVDQHERKDILAMLKRGDFAEETNHG